jgi:hypothetical protein
MPRYLAVVPVQNEGREIAGTPPAEPVAVAPDARLVAIVDNGSWQLAQDVTDAAAYRALRRRHEEGVWQRMRLFVLDATRADALEDGRRVRMDGMPVPDPGRRV